MCTDAELRKHRPLVNRLVYQFLCKLPANVEADDLMQASLIGLAEAIDRFDPGQGVQFETYATQRIRGAMLDELRSADWMSRGDRRQQRAIEDAALRLTHSLGRTPCESEVARAMGLGLHEYQDLVARVCVTLFIRVGRGSLYNAEEAGFGNEMEFFENFATEADDSAMSNLSDPRVRELLSEAIQDLDERQQRIISMHIDEDMTMLEISKVFGFTESRACQIYNAAKDKLRKRMAFYDVPNWRPSAATPEGSRQAAQT